MFVSDGVALGLSVCTAVDVIVAAGVGSTVLLAVAVGMGAGVAVNVDIGVSATVAVGVGVAGIIWLSNAPMSHLATSSPSPSIGRRSSR